MSQIKYIFRDFWWTVAKLNGKKNDYAYLLAKMYGNEHKAVTSQFYNQLRRGEISEQTFRKLFAQALQAPLHKDSATLFHKPVASYASCYKSILHYIQKLQSTGYICTILSDDIVPQADLIKKQGRYDPFDDVLLSCNIGLSKRDDRKEGTTKVFTYALKKYWLQPQEVIFVDDMSANCQVAEKLGIKTVVAQGPRQTIRAIKKLLNA